MVTETDEKKGLVRIYWADIRKRVAKVAPRFAKIVDSLNPDKSFPLYLVYYPYGAVDADTQSSLFPDSMGGYYRLSDSVAPKELLKHLGYSMNNTPFGMVLDKQIECFIDLKSKKITVPWLIYTPGKFFPFTRILSSNKDRVYAPNGLLSSTAGSRSVFMLPNIGCATNHAYLQRDFNLSNSAPKSLYDHWDIFKNIVNSEVLKSEWRCCVMYFSEKWISKLHTDKAWVDLKQYLHSSAWQQFEYEINRIQYDMIFSMIQQDRNLKPNPYLADTARHLFSTAIGAAPGYIPATDDSGLPLDLLQNVFLSSYGLKKYIPTIMQPKHFVFEQDQFPIYYSLQHPSTHVFSPKSREISSTLYEMRELAHVMKIFISDLSKEQGMCADTFLGKVAKSIKVDFFHNKLDSHRIIKPSSLISDLDERFSKYNGSDKRSFASDAPFVRGCISIGS